jgi:hypothetical protein
MLQEKKIIRPSALAAVLLIAASADREDEGI